MQIRNIIEIYCWINWCLPLHKISAIVLNGMESIFFSLHWLLAFLWWNCIWRWPSETSECSPFDIVPNEQSEEKNGGLCWGPTGCCDLSYGGFSLVSWLFEPIWVKDVVGKLMPSWQTFKTWIIERYEQRVDLHLDQ